MNVSELLNEVTNGSVVLPDFQRSFIWEPEDVRELVVSVLGDYFIGSMLILEHFKDDSPFALRLIEGVEKIAASVRMQSIVKILLDGQQRTSALFYALYEPDLPLRNRKSSYRFYLDLERAFRKEWDDAVVGVSRRDRRKLSEIKRIKNIVPFGVLRDIEGLTETFSSDPGLLKKVIKLANDFMNRQIHMVSLPRETDLEKIVETFERINRTGEPLSIFELLTARLYKHNLKLRDLVESFREKNSFAEFIPPEFILKVIALLRGKEPKRKNILELDSQNFVEDWGRACKSLKDAYERTGDIKNGYGIMNFKKWMPYSTMLVPLAAVIDLIRTEKLETKRNYDKIDRWYWAAVFSNRYDQAVDSASANDFTALKDWFVDDGKVPDYIQKFDFNGVDLDIDKQSSAIYRGVISMIILEGALDFETGQPPQFSIEKLQDDHIFPKSVYKDHRVVNRTLISTNSKKSDKVPSEYFREKLDEHGTGRLMMIMKSHLIPEDALDCLLNDDLQNFERKRTEAIIKSLRKKIGDGN